MKAVHQQRCLLPAFVSNSQIWASTHCSNSRMKRNEKKRQNIYVWCHTIKLILYLQGFSDKFIAWIFSQTSYAWLIQLIESVTVWSIILIKYSQVSLNFEVKLQDLRICLCLHGSNEVVTNKEASEDILTPVSQLKQLEDIKVIIILF